MPTSVLSTPDTLFKAIAHPTRRQILTLLAGSDQSVKDLTSSFEMSQPAVSQHLLALREAKLVSSHKVGSEQRYHLTAAPIKTIYDWCIQYRRFFDPAGHAWAFSPTKATAKLPTKKGNSRGR